MKFAQEAVLKKQQEMSGERNTKLKIDRVKVRKITMIVICLKMMILIPG